MRHPVTGKWIEVTIDTHELAWAAGFFDGEGTSGCYKYKEGKCNPMLRFQVVQRELLPLLRFQKAILGLGKISQKHSDISCLKTDKFEYTQAVIAMLWKYLTPIKKDQYKRALKLYHELYNPNLRSDGIASRGDKVRERFEKSRLKRIK